MIYKTNIQIIPCPETIPEWAKKAEIKNHLSDEPLFAMRAEPKTEEQRKEIIELITSLDKEVYSVKKNLCLHDRALVDKITKICGIRGEELHPRGYYTKSNVKYPVYFLEKALVVEYSVTSESGQVYLLAVDNEVVDDISIFKKDLWRFNKNMDFEQISATRINPPKNIVYKIIKG